MANLLDTGKSYVDKMLRNIEGMKVLLLDQETMGIVSMVYSKSEILQKEVFLFERLDIAEREKKLHLKAVCFIRPTPHNISLLQEEFGDPKYSEYHIFFSNVVREQFLEDLAQADVFEVVQQVQEHYADYFVIGPQAFSLNVDSCHSRGDIERVCDGIASCLLSMKRKPIIRYQRNSEACQQVQRELQRKMAQERGLFMFRQHTAPTLLILDRTVDPVTPFLMQWTYQAMVHELIGINNNRVPLYKLNKHIKAQELREIVLAVDQDSFYAKNIYSNFGDLAINVKKELDLLQKKTKSTKTIQTIDDMRNILDNYPEYRKLSGTVSKHTTLLDEMSKIISRDNLMELSEIEQSLACENDHNNAVNLVSKAIASPKFSDINKVKIVLLYALRYETNTSSKVTDFIDALIQSGVDRSLVRLISAIWRFAGEKVRCGDLYSNKNIFAAARNFVKRGLSGATNVYTQHTPYLRDILEDLQKGRLNEQDFPSALEEVNKTKVQEVIVFFVGGTTYEELKMIAELNKDPSLGLRVILGGSTIHNSDSFLRELASFSN